MTPQQWLALALIWTALGWGWFCRDVGHDAHRPCAWWEWLVMAPAVAIAAVAIGGGAVWQSIRGRRK